MKVPALVIALVICLGVLNAVNLTPLLGPLLYTMTPLQRYYATDYLASSWHKNDPAATTETRLLWKMKKGKSEFATEQDVIAKPFGQVIWAYSPEPFLLSDKASAEGWATVVQGRRQEINSAKLNTFLEQEIYDGNELWQFFLQPVLGLATLGFVLLVFRAWRQERWERGWWKQNQPQLSFWAWSLENLRANDETIAPATQRPRDSGHPAIPSVGIKNAGCEPDSHRFRGVRQDEAGARTCRGSRIGFRFFDQEICCRPGPCLSHSCSFDKAEAGVRLG